MTQIPPTVLPTDDPGDNTTGTKWNRSWVQALLDAINPLIHSTTNPTLTPSSIIDEVFTARGGLASLDARFAALLAFITSLGVNTDISVLHGETVVANDALYMSDGTDGRTAGRFYKPSGVTPNGSLIAFSVAGALISTNGLARVGGMVTGLVGLTIGAIYYADTATPGALTTTPNQLKVGRANSATTLIIEQNQIRASSTLSGIVSTLAQDFAGAKRFLTAPTMIPGTVAAGVQDATIGGVFIKNTTATGSSTGGIVKLTGDVTVKGNTLSADGKTVKFTTLIIWPANANNKSMIVYYGGSAIFNLGAFAGTGAGGFQLFEVTITRTAASAQKILVRNTFGTQTTGGCTVNAGYSSFALDNTADQIFKIEAGIAVANNDLVHVSTIGEVIG